MEKAAGKTRSGLGGRADAGDILADTDQLSRWIEAGELPELRKAYQQRSLRTALGLLESGWVLLRDRSLDEISIELLCARAKVTVGSFYARFETKQSYFRTLQRVHFIRSASRRQEFIEYVREHDLTLPEFCRAYVGNSVSNFRSGVGIVRSTLQQKDGEPWQKFRPTGVQTRMFLEAWLPKYFPDTPREELGRRIKFAHQMFIGTLIHAALDDNGPISLFDDEIVIQLAKMIESYLGASVGDGLRSPRV